MEEQKEEILNKVKKKKDMKRKRRDGQEEGEERNKIKIGKQEH